EQSVLRLVPAMGGDVGEGGATQAGERRGGGGRIAREDLRLRMERGDRLYLGPAPFIAGTGHEQYPRVTSGSGPAPTGHVPGGGRGRHGHRTLSRGRQGRPGHRRERPGGYGDQGPVPDAG